MMEHIVPRPKAGVFTDGMLPSVNALYYIDAEQRRHTRFLHSHDNALELAYIYSGRGLHMIGDTTYEVLEDDVLIFNEGVLHAETPHPDWNGDFRYLCLALKDVHLPGLPRNTVLSAGFVPVLRLGSERGARLRNLFEILLAETQNGSDGEICQSLAVSILLMIRGFAQKADPMPQDASDELARRVKGFLDEHYLEELSLDSIAEQLAVSPYYMGRKFKAYTGVSPMQYVTNRRIGLAQTYLQETFLPVTKIAELCGYENSNYFNASFKKNIGTSPGVYRQSIKFSGFYK